jgi:hypothetical protein
LRDGSICPQTSIKPLSSGPSFSGRFHRFSRYDLPRFVENDNRSESDAHQNVADNDGQRKIIHGRNAFESFAIFKLHSKKHWSNTMALIDELTERITAELHRTLDQCIRQAVESYVIGDGNLTNHQTDIARFPGNNRRTRRTQQARRGRADKSTRERRSRTIIDAVVKLGEASIEDVARATGLDKRGVGSSLHYLAAAGKLKQVGSGKYKAPRSTQAA